MEIMKGKSKLKNTSVEDIVFEDRAKNQFFISNGDTQPVENVQFKKEAEGIVKNTLTDQEKRQAYNRNITNLDPNFTKLKPLGSYLIRMFVSEDEITKSGLIIPSSAKHFTRSQTNSGFVGDKIPNPYRFTSKAVIVSAPEFEQELKPGMVVQVVQLLPIVDKDTVVDYQNSYIHPDDLSNTPTTDVEDPGFGYAIINRNAIKVIVE